MIDQITRLKSCNVYDTNSGIIEPVCWRFNCWKQAYKHVNILEMDNEEGNIKKENKLIRKY